MRTFIAIPFPSPLVQRLETARGELRDYLMEQNAGDGLRWVNMTNVHLTLRFLGETSMHEIETLQDQLEAIARRHDPISLYIDSLGGFPNLRQPRVLWFGMKGELEQLHSLQRAVELAAQRTGFEAESRPYSPHITVARVRRGVAKSELKLLGDQVQLYCSRFSESTRPRHAISFRADRIVHLQSQLGPGGSVYTPLARFELSKIG